MKIPQNVEDQMKTTWGHSVIFIINLVLLQKFRKIFFSKTKNSKMKWGDKKPKKK